MLQINTILHYLRNPRNIVAYLLIHYPNWIKDDKRYIKLLWKTRMNYPLNLDSPQTYNEKLQWLKLYYRDPILTTLVDKELVKSYVSNIIGENYIIPTLGVWDNPKEIDFALLPNQFVLKCTHDSGGIVICKDKSLLDIPSVIEKLEKSLNNDFYLLAREWPYKNVSRKIIAEEYMEDHSTKELRDYKFFCFNGVPKWMFIATGRQAQKEPYFDFFDMNFNHLELSHGHPNSPIQLERPQSFDEMKELASKLSKDFPHVRVDLYEINGKVYFGELTFFHHSGLVPFEPHEWDHVFGNDLDIRVL